MLRLLTILTFALCSTGTAQRIDGITVSTPRSGQDWGSDAIVGTLEEIRAVGGNWVATHPYAFIRNTGQLRWREIDPERPAPAELVRPIEEAHRLGMKVLIKPHVGYWGSKFSWRGDIQFADPAERDRFWGDYTRWIVGVAKACKDADAFAVGTELDKMLDVDRWKKIIAAIREVTDAPLTYAANWTDYKSVGFWDALDAIGIQAYFPLTDHPTADEARIRAGWRSQMAELNAYSKKIGKHIVFTELGYNRSFNAAVEPWAAKMDGQDAEATQLVCMRVALEEVQREPRVVGAFLWKWFPGPVRRRHDFQIQDPDVLRTVTSAWKK